MKKRQNELFVVNIPPNVAFLHLLVYSRTILVDVSTQKVNFNFFRFCLIVKLMISLFNLNTRCAGPRATGLVLTSIKEEKHVILPTTLNFVGRRGILRILTLLNPPAIF